MLTTILSACGTGASVRYSNVSSELTREPKRILIVASLYDFPAKFAQRLSECGVAVEIVERSSPDMKAVIQAKTATFAPDFAFEAMKLREVYQNGTPYAVDHKLSMTDLTSRKEVWSASGTISFPIFGTTGTYADLADMTLRKLVADKVLKSCPAVNTAKEASK